MFHVLFDSNVWFLYKKFHQSAIKQKTRMQAWRLQGLSSKQKEHGIKYAATRVPRTLTFLLVKSLVVLVFIRIQLVRRTQRL